MFLARLLVSLNKILSFDLKNIEVNFIFLAHLFVSLHSVKKNGFLQ